MIRKTALALLLAAAGVNAHADTIIQWNFNSPTPDAVTSTGTLNPAVGNGVASLLNTTGSFSSGDASGGSSDPASGDDSGWQTTSYATQGTGNKSEGVQFNFSTIGYTGVNFSYDLRHSNTSSRYELVQYSLDGTTFNDFATFDGNIGDTWFKGRSVDFSSILGANNNANFAVRVVATFAPGTNNYAASSATGTYGTTGTWRFDMATATAMPVPEPKNYAMFLAGIGLMGFMARRRSR